MVRADIDPDDLPPRREVERRVAARFATAAVLWAVGAVVVAAVAVVGSFLPGFGLGPGTGSIAEGLLLVVVVLSLAAVALVAVGALRTWRYEIESYDSRLDRYRWARRYRLVRLLLVVGFAFLAGMMLWFLDLAIVPLVGVVVGFPAVVGLACWEWDRLDDLGRQLVVVGVSLVLIHPFSLFILRSVGPAPTAAGYVLLAAGLARAAWTEAGGETVDGPGPQAEDRVEASR